MSVNMWSVTACHLDAILQCHDRFWEKMFRKALSMYDFESKLLFIGNEHLLKPNYGGSDLLVSVSVEVYL